MGCATNAIEPNTVPPMISRITAAAVSDQHKCATFVMFVAHSEKDMLVLPGREIMRMHVVLLSVDRYLGFVCRAIGGSCGERCSATCST